MSKKKTFFPVSSDVIRVACSESLERLVINIMEIDQSIFMWNDLLERAQPFLNGRLVFRFIKHDQWVKNGEVHFEYLPIPGKMVKFVSGNWRFVQLDKVDKFKTLSDLRVGKRISGDAVVRRLIDGIEEMLAHRKVITDQLRALRMLATGQSAHVTKRTEEMTQLALTLSTKLKIDWKENTDAAIEAQRVKDHLRYEKRKDRIKLKRDMAKNKVL